MMTLKPGMGLRARAWWRRRSGGGMCARATTTTVVPTLYVCALRRRVCVMAAEVVRVQKRVRDGDDDEASRGRVVRVRRGVEAGGASTPHQDGGGGILSGSGAV